MEFDLPKRKKNTISHRQEELKIAIQFSDAIRKEMGKFLSGIILFGSSARKTTSGLPPQCHEPACVTQGSRRRYCALFARCDAPVASTYLMFPWSCGQGVAGGGVRRAATSPHAPTDPCRPLGQSHNPHRRGWLSVLDRTTDAQPGHCAPGRV